MNRKWPTQTEKMCCGCDAVKAARHFYLMRSGRLHSRCRECVAVANKTQNTKHQVKRREYDSARGTGWVRSGRESWNPPEPVKHDKYLRRAYGISLAEYDDIFAAQGRVCAICRCECNRSTTTRLCVDHNHDTGRVRGLLCFQCNVGLGKFLDSYELISAAADYLKQER